MREEVRLSIAYHEAGHVAIAGVEAQQRHGPLPWYGAGNDWQRAYNLARAVCLSDKEAFAYLKWLEIVAREQIEASWPDVEKVASALCERGTLSEAELVRLSSLRPCPANDDLSNRRSRALDRADARRLRRLEAQPSAAA
jgi:hypothetical protein